MLPGICGVNHGIELYEDVVEYARMKVQEFALESPSFDRFVFLLYSHGVAWFQVCFICLVQFTAL